MTTVFTGVLEEALHHGDVVPALDPAIVPPENPDIPKARSAVERMRAGVLDGDVQHELVQPAVRAGRASSSAIAARP